MSDRKRQEPPISPYGKPVVLSIAGSDCGGGAGIQGDIKSIEANGAFAMTVVTAITAQNSLGVYAIEPVSLSMIKAQIHAIAEDFSISALKTGMLASKAITKTVSQALSHHQWPNLVIDPVLSATDHSSLLEDDALETLKHALIPQARLITPNVAEAERLSGKKIAHLDDAKEVAYLLSKFGPKAVLITGGHLSTHPGCDILLEGNSITTFEGEWINSPHTHGTGCTYSAAIAAQLARGLPLTVAIKTAKSYVTEAIRHRLDIGHGHGPMHQLYALPRPELCDTTSEKT